MGWLVAVALGLATALFVPGLLEQFEVPKTEAVRVFGLAGLAWGVARGWPWRLKPLVFLDVAVLAWLAVEIAATLTSVVPRLSVFGEPEQRDGLLSSLALAGLYVAMRMRPGRRGAGEPAKAKDRRASRDARSALPAVPGPLHPALEVFVAAMVFASLYAVVQATRNDPIPWTGVPIYGTYPRPGATFGHPNLLGVASAAAAALALATAVARRNPWWLAVAGLFAVANALTLSRAAWLALIASAPVALLLARNGGPAAERPLLTRSQLFSSALAVVVVAGALVATGLAEPLVIRLRELFAPLEGSGRSRLEIWRTAFAAWQARPWLGQGPDTFLLVFPQFQTAEYWRQEWGLVPLHAHSVYLHVLATRGALGVAVGALLVASMGVAAGRAWRRGERELAGMAFGALVAIGVGGAFGTPGVVGGALTMVIAGALATRPAPATPPTGRTAVVIAALVGIVAFAWVTLELMASHAAAHARLHLLRDPRRAAALAARAERLAPYDDLSPSLRAQSVLAIDPEAPDRAERMRDARSAIARALAMAPQRSLHHQTHAYLLAGSAAPDDTTRIAAAEAALARALALAPMDGRLLQQYADLELALGRPALAAVPAARAAQLYPGEASAQALHAITRAALGDTAGARAALRRAIDGRWRDDGSGRMRAIRALEALSETP